MHSVYVSIIKRTSCSPFWANELHWDVDDQSVIEEPDSCTCVGPGMIVDNQLVRLLCFSVLLWGSCSGKLFMFLIRVWHTSALRREIARTDIVSIYIDLPSITSRLYRGQDILRLLIT